MSKYRYAIVCHNCNTKTIQKRESNTDVCYKCGCDKRSEHIEQYYVGGELNRFLDEKVNNILR